MTTKDDNLDPNMALADVPRNDLEAAERYYRSHGRRITGEEWRVLWHLQDDPRAFERSSRHWRIVASQGTDQPHRS